MVCQNGIKTGCAPGSAGACEYKPINESFGFPSIYTPAKGFNGGFTIEWDEALFPSYYLRLLYRKKTDLTFGYPDEIRLRSVGFITVTGLAQDTLFDLYARQESDNEAGPWERLEVETSAVLTPDSKSVNFKADFVQFNNLNVVVG
jgi:hypothetical protein